MDRKTVHIIAFCMVLIGSLMFCYNRAFAEEVIPSDDSSVTEPTIDSGDLAGIQSSLDKIIEILSPSEELPEETPAPDYTEQLQQIETTLSNIEQNTQPEEPVPVVSAFAKPFEEYSVLETLVLLLLLVISVYGFIKIFVKGWY